MSASRQSLVLAAVAVENERADLIAGLAQLLHHIDMHQWVACDHACAECGGSIPITNFRCGYHAARALLARVSQ